MSDNFINVVLEIVNVDGKVTTRNAPSTPAPVKSSQVSSAEPDWDSSVVSESSEFYDKVFVYDVNDITMSSNEQLEELKQKFPQMKNINRVSKLINTVLNRAKFDDPNKLKARDAINIQNIVDDGIDVLKTIGQYDVIVRAYKLFIGDLLTNRKSISHPDMKVLIDRWECAKKCLSLSSDTSDNKKYANVALCEDGLAYGVARIGVAGLAKDFPIDNIFSTLTRPIETVLELIQKRFGQHCQLIVVTSNEKTIAAAKKLVIPFWPVYCDGDFEALYDHEFGFRFPRQNTVEKQEKEVEDAAQAELEAQYKKDLAKVQALLTAQTICDQKIDENEARIQAFSEKEAQLKQALANVKAQHTLLESQVKFMTNCQVQKSLADVKARHVELEVQVENMDKSNAKIRHEMNEVQSEQAQFTNHFQAFAKAKQQQQTPHSKIKEDSTAFEQSVNSRLQKMATLRDALTSKGQPTREQYMREITKLFGEVRHY